MATKHKVGWKKLGYANSWDKTPKELMTCRKKGHIINYYDNNGVSTHFCTICRIEYKIDSSD